MADTMKKSRLLLSKSKAQLKHQTGRQKNQKVPVTKPIIRRPKAAE